MKIPQMMPWVGKYEYQAIESCFSNNWITEGPKAKEFLDKLLNQIGASYGVFAPNCTLGLFLALKAFAIGQGDEVIIPDFTFIASATAVEMTGARPIFVDVNKRNFQIDITNAERAVTKSTKVIMPVHMYGTIADMKSVLLFAKKHNLKVIEDAAQAFGVRREGKHSGTFGDIGCFSFYADKTITTGEGGLVVTNNKNLYEQMSYLQNHGRITSGTFIHPKIGYNLRITDIQAAIGLAQLKKLPEIIKRKQKILSTYKKLLKNTPDVIFFEPDQNVDWFPFRIPILVPNREKLIRYLKKHEIEPRTFFYPLHKQPAFSYLNSPQKYSDKMFPNSVYGYEHGLCLPAFPQLNSKQIFHICTTINKFFNETK